VQSEGLVNLLVEQINTNYLDAATDLSVARKRPTTGVNFNRNPKIFEFKTVTLTIDIARV
jgi:hypothetical protein